MHWKAEQLGITIGLVLVPTVAHAGDLPVDWIGTRGQAMGGATTAFANSPDEMYSNPAGLARFRSPRSRQEFHELGLPGIQIGGNLLALQGLDAAFTSDTEKPSSLGDASNVSEAYFEADRFGRILNQAVNNPGVPIFAEAQFHTYGVFGGRSAPTWFVGVPLRSELTLGVPSATDTSMISILSKTTVGLMVAMADMSRTGLITWGIAARPNYRYAYETESWPSSSTAFSDFRKTVAADAHKTFALPVDLGLQITAPDMWLPTLGITVRNIPTGCVDDYTNPVTGKSYTVCGTLRSGGTGKTQDRLDPTEIRAGISIIPRFRAGRAKINLRIAGDVFPLPIAYEGKSYGFNDLNINDLIHAGAELFFGNAHYDHVFAIRGGVHGVDFTFGLGFSFLGMDWSYATYPGYSFIKGGSEDKDRRHLIAMTARW